MSKQARVDVILNTEQAKAALKEVQSELKQVKTLRDKAFESGDIAGYNQLNTQFKKLTSEAGKLEKQSKDINDVMKNLSSASIRELNAAYQQMNRELNQMKRNDPGYAAKQKDVKLLRTELNAATNEMKVHQSGMSRLAEGFNKYFTIVTAGAATLTGLVLGVRKAVDTFNEFEQSVANLSAITGLTGNDLNWLSERAKELSVSTTESGIKITKSATDIVEGFKLMGSARPELLQNKEALAQVTEKALILAAASKIEMAPAVDAVAASMNQFNLEASQSDRIINAIAAGSLAGSAEVGDLTESMKNVGTVASDSNMSLEQTVAALEVLGEKQLKGAEAGTKLRGALLKMKDAGVGYASGQFVVSDALEEVNKRIDAQGSALEKDAIKQKVFGIENQTAGAILLQNIDKYDKLTAAVTGTNVAFDQAKTATATNSAKLDQAKNRVQLLTIEFGQKLAPAMTFSTNSFAYFMKAAIAGIEVFAKYKEIIVTTILTIAAYTTAVKLQALWEERKNAASTISITISKLKRTAMLAEIAATQLWAAVTMLATGNIQGAAQAMLVFNTVLKANPAGLIVGAIIALGTALYFLSQRTTSAQKAQQALTDMEAEAMKSVVDQKMAMEALLKTAKDETKSKLDRQAAVKKLNEISPEYLGNLTLDKIKTQEAQKATDNYIESLMKQARVMAAQEKMKELEKQKIDLQISGKGSETSFWQDMGNAILSAGNAATFTSLSMKSIVDNYVGTINDITAQQVALEKIIKGNGAITPGGNPTKTSGANNEAANISEVTDAYKKLNDTIDELAKKRNDYKASGLAVPAEIEKQYTELLAKKNAIDTKDNGKTAIKSKEESYKQQLEIQKKAIDSSIALMQEGTGKELAELKAKYDAEKELIKHELETNKKLTPEETKNLTTTSKNLDKKYETDKKAINKKLLNEELQFQKQLITLQLETATEGTFGEYNLKKQQIEINRQIELAGITETGEKKTALQKAINEKFDAERNKLDQAKNLTVLSQNFYNEASVLNKAYDNNSRALKTQYDQGKITKKQYNDQLYDLDSQYERDILALAIEEAQKKLQILKDTGLASLSELQQAQDAIDALTKSATDKSTGKGNNKDTKSKGFKDMSSEDKMNYAIQVAQTTADAIFQIEADNNQRILDNKISQLNTQREKELAQKNLTDAQKEEINKKYDEKERKLKAEAWQKQHKADIIQSIIKGALGVLSGLAQGGIPGAILAGVIAAAEIITVASQKQPEFYEGGYTSSDTSDKKPVGVVHANEFIGSAAAVRNPSIKKYFDIIDYAQKNGTVSQINLTELVTTSTLKGHQAGGYSSDITAASGTTVTHTSTGTKDVDLSALLTRAVTILEKLEREGVEAKLYLNKLEKIMDNKTALESSVDN